jgi:hypothetical protein
VYVGQAQYLWCRDYLLAQVLAMEPSPARLVLVLTDAVRSVHLQVGLEWVPTVLDLA